MRSKAKGGRGVFEGIIVMLFSLANILEASSSRPAALRRYLLALISPTAGLVESMIYSVADDLAVPDPDFAALAALTDQDIDQPDDMLRLAASLRVLACALAWLHQLNITRQRQWRSFEIGQHQPWRAAMRRLHVAMPAGTFGPAVATIDTS